MALKKFRVYFGYKYKSGINDMERWLWATVRAESKSSVKAYLQEQYNAEWFPFIKEER